MNGGQSSQLGRRVVGTLLILLGSIALFALPAGFFYIDALACGMGTTGCHNYSFPWGEAAMMLFIPMLIAAAIAWLGFRLWR